MEPTKENSLYLLVTQQVFEDIVSGRVREERREILDATYLRLIKTDKKEPVCNPEKISPKNELRSDPMVYNGGVFPFYLKEYLFLNLSAGYGRKHDSAIVEIKEAEAVPSVDEDGHAVRISFDDDDCGHPDPHGDFTVWTVVYHLGHVVRLDRERPQVSGHA